MGKTSKTLSRCAALAVVLGLAGGCAHITQEEWDEYKSTTNTALSEARAAKSAADAAASAARSAQAAADAAQRTADEALACCRDNSDKIERMFEKTMKK